MAICKLTLVSFLMTLGMAFGGPLMVEDDSISVPAIQFRSKVNSEDVCTGYQIHKNWFVAPGSCLGRTVEDFAANRELEIVGQGTQSVQVFGLRPNGLSPQGDFAVVMYNGQMEENQIKGGDIMEQLGLSPHVRLMRQETGTGAADGAGSIEVSCRLISGVLFMLFAVVFMK
ncbi:uncharacterized protein LOC129749728 [Uranotaenia lowii]|uniref:uncharacterized protein LOC129749728 n=1 Tax=Uranotaenia lowii TaxID=190385 RepID=UPI0024785BDF|nr:uncharacterized protein LOC129749728 [Uranotaenia lowii]